MADRTAAGGAEPLLGRPAAPRHQRPRFSQMRYWREDLEVMGVPALCLDERGRLWRFRRGRVDVLEPGGGAAVPMTVEEAPPGPWRHTVACDCEVCRLGIA